MAINIVIIISETANPEKYKSVCEKIKAHSPNINIFGVGSAYNMYVRDRIDKADGIIVIPGVEKWTINLSNDTDAFRSLVSYADSISKPNFISYVASTGLNLYKLTKTNDYIAGIAGTYSDFGKFVDSCETSRRVLVEEAIEQVFNMEQPTVKFAKGTIVDICETSPDAMYFKLGLKGKIIIDTLGDEYLIHDGDGDEGGDRTWFVHANFVTLSLVKAEPVIPKVEFKQLSKPYNRRLLMCC